MAKAARKRKGGEFIQALMSMGRGSDNTIGHLTPGEIVIPREVVDQDPSVLTPFIRAMTKRGEDWRQFEVGKGKVNPRTGVQEFLSIGGREVTPGSWSTTNPSPAPGTGLGRESTRSTDIIGSATPRTGPVSVGGQAVNVANVTGREPTYAEGGPMGSAGSRPGGPAAVGEQGTFERMLNDAVGAPSGRSLGLLGTLAGAIPGIGTLMSFTNLMQNVFGVEGDMDWEPGNPNPGSRESTRGTWDHRSPAARQINQIANAAVAAGLIDPPAWLRRSIEGLSPLQQRAFIATQGTAGSDSSYRSRDAFDYYRGLITNTPYENVLPVEHQYLRDIWGANYGNNTSSLMQALAAI